MPPAESQIELPADASAREHSLLVHTDSPPGRYHLDVSVMDAANQRVAQDRLPVYIYP